MRTKSKETKEQTNEGIALRDDTLGALGATMSRRTATLASPGAKVDNVSTMKRVTDRSAPSRR